MPAVSRERPIWDKGSNKENTGIIRENQNLQNGFSKQQEQEESSVKNEEEWIKIGDQYFQNPVSITVNGTLKQVVKEFVIADPVSDQFDQKNEIQKRKRDQFEAENQQEAAPNMSNAFIKNRSTNSEETYVKLDIINERFMSTVVDLEENEDKVNSLPCGFRTKRRYLYEI